MQFFKNEAGIFISDDEARLVFKGGNEPPTDVIVFVIGKTSFHTPEKIEIPLLNLKYLATFAADQDLKKFVPWGSNAVYSIYLETQKDKIVVVQSLSGVNKFFFIDQVAVSNCFNSILNFLESSEIWSLLECMIGTYDKCYLEGVKEGGRKYKEAFIENRLRKRKDPGSDNYKIWIDART